MVAVPLEEAVAPYVIQGSRHRAVIQPRRWRARLVAQLHGYRVALARPYPEPILTEGEPFLVVRGNDVRQLLGGNILPCFFPTEIKHDSVTETPLERDLVNGHRRASVNFISVVPWSIKMSPTVGVQVAELLHGIGLTLQVVNPDTALIYQRLGFVRLLGIAHVMWIPMLLWFTARLEGAFDSDPIFGSWLLLLMVTNFLSLLVDSVDIARFLRGEKAPHYAWKKS